MRKGFGFGSVRRLTVISVAAFLCVLMVPAGASAAPPPNDNFANAATITDRFGWVEGDNTDATKEPGEPNHAGNPGGASVWYTWTAPSSGHATFSLCYAEFDSLLAVYTGDALTNLQQVAADDNGCGDQSYVTFTASAGVTYRIAVDGANGDVGYFELDWGVAPPNDDFAASAELSGDSGTAQGDNRYATLEQGEPQHGPNGGASVWYRWTAPSTGPATLDLCDSEFDSQLAVYTGASVDGLTLVAQDDNDCPDEWGARVSFTAAAGQEYRIAVDGAYGDQGNLVLHWSRSILAPVNHAPPAVFGRPIDGAMLSAGQGSWGGTAPFNFGYQWLRCTLNSCEPISGATGATYQLGSSDVAYRVMVLVTASNSAGSATAGSDVTAIVAPAPPASITAPRIIGDPYLGEDVSVEEGQWSGTEPFTYGYEWQRCRAGACSFVEDGSSHTIGRADLGSSLVVVVTATNGAGSATAASAPSRRVSRRPVCVVPRVLGKKLAAARRSIRGAHCSVGRLRRAKSPKKAGRVIAQGPRPGTRKPAGTRVNLVVSKGRR
jgi:PASTA domain-containing protein